MASRSVSTGSFQYSFVRAWARADVGRGTSSGFVKHIGRYTFGLTLKTKLRRLEMNPMKSEKTTSVSGSIAVYQRLKPGKRPGKVEIIRSVYDTFRNPQGIAFGRTNNTVLLRLPSGLDCLRLADAAALAQHGLNEIEIARVNRRLLALAGPARARALEMDVVEVQAKLDWIGELVEATPLVSKQVGDLVRIVAEKLDVDDDIGANPSEPGTVDPFEALRDAFAAINRACGEAQALYRQLPKREVPDEVLSEYQKTWFSYPDMLATFTVRKAFSRPSGWSKLRAKVETGEIVRKKNAPISA